MINLGHFVIGRKHEFCVIDLFEIDASLNLSANFDRSALRVLLQNDVLLISKTVFFGKVKGDLAGGYVILVLAVDRFPMANKGEIGRAHV